ELWRDGEGLMMASWKSAYGWSASGQSGSWPSGSWRSAPWKFAVLGVGLLLGGCIQTTLEPASTASMKPHDKELLAHPPYAQAQIPLPYQRHLVDYHRKEAPGTIVIDTDNRFLYLVQEGGRAIRYGVTVGEEAQGWS